MAEYDYRTNKDFSSICTDPYKETDTKKLKVAKTISAFTNAPIFCIPLFIIICAILASTGTPFSPEFSFNCDIFLKCELISLMFITIIPMIIILSWAKMRDTDNDISNKEDRLIPLIIGTVSYLFGVIISYLIGLPNFLTLILLCYTTNTFIVMLITLKWKISVHTTGIAGPIAALTMLAGPFGALFGIFYPIVIWSRTSLKKHTLAQAVVGGIFGLIFTIVETYLYADILNLPAYNLYPIIDSFWLIFAIMICPIIISILGFLYETGYKSNITRKIFDIIAFLAYALLILFAPKDAILITIIITITSILVSIYGNKNFTWFNCLRRDIDSPKESLNLLFSSAIFLIWIIISWFLLKKEITIIVTLLIAIFELIDLIYYKKHGKGIIR